MKNIPEKIYLQIDADGETPEDFKELTGVSWCVDKINSNDIKYSLSPSPTPDWTKEKTYDSEGTVDKEAIRKDIANLYKEYIVHSELDPPFKVGMKMYNEAVVEYAASLKKENEELKEWRDRLIDEKNALISSNEAKEKENSDISNHNKLLIKDLKEQRKQLSEKDNKIEILKQLLKKEFWFSRRNFIEATILNAWQGFVKENLNSDMLSNGASQQQPNSSNEDGKQSIAPNQ